MKSCIRILTGTVMVLALSLAVVPLAVAQEAEISVGRDVSTSNIMITVRAGAIEGGKRVPLKSYNLVVADGTPGSKLLAGQRVPFPAATKDEPDAIVYQNIGFAVEARAWIVDKKTIKVSAEIEDSRVVEGDKGAPPTVETRQLGVNAMLTDGVPLELTRVESEDRSGFVEVEAKILR